MSYKFERRKELVVVVEAEGSYCSTVIRRDGDVAIKILESPGFGLFKSGPTT
jgi:hypothetical protein